MTLAPPLGPALAALALLLAPPPPPESPHPLSLAFLEIRVEDDAVEVLFRPQATTVLEVQELALDRDGDLELSRAEVDAAWPRIRDWLRSGLVLELDGELRHLDFREHDFEPLPEALGGARSPLFSRLIARARLPLARRPERLAVHYELFFEEGNPDHRVHVTVTGLSPRPRRYLLDAGHRSTELRRESTLGLYLALGWRHVLDGSDHLAFLLALLLGVAGIRSLVEAVTAFTLAHSLTLAASALGILTLAPQVVEPGIAASVLVVVWLHLAQGPGRARAWLPAFAFGLLHGFGFAGVLGEIGLPPGARATALFGFNLGVEAGQLTFVLPVAMVAGLAARRTPESRRRELRLVAGTVLGAFALGLVADRLLAWWLPGAMARWPAPLRGLPPAAAVLLPVLLGLRLAGRRRPELRALSAAALGSGLLYALFAAGRLLAALRGAA